MPSDKRDGGRKSDRSSGSGSGPRQSATVTSDSAVPVSTASSRSGVVASSAGTVRPVTSVTNSKRMDRECSVVDSHRAPSCSAASMFDHGYVSMPNTVVDACVDMLSIIIIKNTF